MPFHSHNVPESTRTDNTLGIPEGGTLSDFLFEKTSILDNSVPILSNFDNLAEIVEALADMSYVKLTTDQVIDGFKTFTQNILLPEGGPTDDFHAVSKAYVNESFEELHSYIDNKIGIIGEAEVNLAGGIGTVDILTCVGSYIVTDVIWRCTEAITGAGKTLYISMGKAANYNELIQDYALTPDSANTILPINRVVNFFDVVPPSNMAGAKGFKFSNGDVIRALMSGDALDSGKIRMYLVGKPISV